VKLSKVKRQIISELLSVAKLSTDERTRAIIYNRVQELHGKTRAGEPWLLMDQSIRDLVSELAERAVLFDRESCMAIEQNGVDFP
jgi:hypothetical protein